MTSQKKNNPPPCDILEDIQSTRTLERNNAMKNVQGLPPSIPRIFHHQGKDLNPKMDEAHWSTLMAFPVEEGWTHMYWDDAMADKLIKDKYNWFYSTYSQYPENIMRIDAARYFILNEFGGIYSDLDIEILFKHTDVKSPELETNLPPPMQTDPREATEPGKEYPSLLLPSSYPKPTPQSIAVGNTIYSLFSPSKVSLIESPYKYNEEFQNSFMVSPRKHIFWEKVVFHLLIGRFNSWNTGVQDKGVGLAWGEGGVLWMTGPKMVSYAVDSLDVSDEGVDNMIVKDEKNQYLRQKNHVDNPAHGHIYKVVEDVVGGFLKKDGEDDGEEKELEGEGGTNNENEKPHSEEDGVDSVLTSARSIDILPCELFQRIPTLGLFDTPKTLTDKNVAPMPKGNFVNRLGKLLLPKLYYKNKYCGDFDNLAANDCQLVKHHGIGGWAVGNVQW